MGFETKITANFSFIWKKIDGNFCKIDGN